MKNNILFTNLLKTLYGERLQRLMMRWWNKPTQEKLEECIYMHIIAIVVIVTRNVTSYNSIITILCPLYMYPPNIRTSQLLISYSLSYLECVISIFFQRKGGKYTYLYHHISTGDALCAIMHRFQIKC